MDFSGPQVSINHLWHHRDHVAVTPLTSVGGKKNLGFQVRARTRIHELTNEVNDVIYFEMQTVRLDNREFTFKIMMGNTPVGRLRHLYTPTPDGGSTFYAETQIGLETDNPIINRRLAPRLYNKQSALEWTRHNIQETGRLQDILPVLYANRDKLFYDPEFIKFT